MVPDRPDLVRYRDEMRAELTDDILAYWLDNVIDFASGGFHGCVSNAGVADPKAAKGVILATRILWTFSRAHTRLRDERYLRAAELVYRFVREYFLDAEHGGVFWMVDHQGRPLDTTKKFYAQAFAIYAFCDYYRASGDPQALEEARRIFALVEDHGRDREDGGYLDALGRDFQPVADTRLSDVDLNTPKSMNTNLHVLEAYSELARLEPGGPAAAALTSLTEVFLEKIIMPNRHFGLFFDLKWNEVSGNISYGHDIEGSWLLHEAALRTADEDLLARVHPVAVDMARAVLEEGLDPRGGILRERNADGSVKPGKEWWMQSEAMVGFHNAFELTGDERFLRASWAVWGFCKQRFLRPGGEWYFGIDDEGVPDPKLPVVGPWKCPYHTSRTCLELIERIDRNGGLVDARSGDWAPMLP